MSLQTRPVALEVQPENIPAELKALPIWSCWRYEWNEKRQNWGKVPYTPYTVRHASCTCPSSWRSFDAAYACYQERRDFFDGVFIALQADDPYTGGDFDHCHADHRLPDTYAELSPSATGIRFIGRGTIPSACKKPAGELYNERRFLSITGHKLPSAPADIRPIQPVLNALYAELKGSTKVITEGTAGNDSRAELVKTIPVSEWEAARQLARTQGDELMRRLRASCGEGTRLALLLAGDYAGFHRRWPFVGIYRADGTPDDSQIRAVMARSIKGRGFMFPQYVVQMSRLFAAQALKKWGTKQAWREELAALWFKSPDPKRLYEPRPSYLVPIKQPKDDVIEIPRGRGRPSHAPEVERFYLFLRETISNTDPMKIGDLADAYGVHRRTASTYLNELRTAKRITTRRLARGKGLIITFDDVIEFAAGETDDSPAAMAEIDAAAAPHEETRDNNCVSSLVAEADHITEEQPPEAPCPPVAAEPAATPAPALTPPDVRLADVVRDTFDFLGVDLQTGERRRIFTREVLAVVRELGHWSELAILRAIEQERQRRRWSRQDEQDVRKAATMRLDLLQRTARALAAQAAATERACKTGVELPAVLEYEFNGHTYRTKTPKAPTLRYAGWLRRRAGIYAAEEARRMAADQARFDTQLDQAIMLGDIAEARGPIAKLRTIGRAVKIEPPAAEQGTSGAVCPPQTPPAAAGPTIDVGGLIARLKQRQVQGALHDNTIR
jgi:hypothetical protein